MENKTNITKPKQQNVANVIARSPTYFISIQLHHFFFINVLTHQPKGSTEK
jgi:hypothetical protein